LILPVSFNYYWETSTIVELIFEDFVVFGGDDQEVGEVQVNDVRNQIPLVEVDSVVVRVEVRVVDEVALGLVPGDEHPVVRHVLQHPRCEGDVQVENVFARHCVQEINLPHIFLGAHDDFSDYLLKSLGSTFSVAFLLHGGIVIL
jgi:hypothetical protein